MGAPLLGLELQRGCKGRQEWSVEAREERLGADFAPESQTLIVLSQEPDTIFVPSGEKTTDVILSLCAFVFSVLRSSVAVWGGKRRQIWPTRDDFGLLAHLHPSRL